MNYRARSVAVLVCSLVGCSSPTEATPSGGAAGQAGAPVGGGSSGGVGGSGGTGMAGGGQTSTGGVAGGTGGGGSGAGMSGASGSATAGMGGGGGSAGSGGAMGCIEAGSPGKTGKQCDPGTMGDGSFDQVEPQVNQPPEAMGDPAGELAPNATLESEVYGYAFTYRTYKPTAYQAGKPAALMIFQDGTNYTGNFKAPQVFDALIEEGSVPVTISVYIQPTNQRGAEYDTRSDKYARMLTTELIPKIAESFDLVDDPNGWAIAGHSSGGSCAFNAAWWFPDKFRKVLTHSGSFTDLANPGDDEYIELVKTEAKKPLRVTLQSGTGDLDNQFGNWMEANTAMAASFEEAGYPYRFMKSTTAHGPTKWHVVDFPDAMRWLWKGYSLPQ
jgi:enterochelin esterase family protein